MCFPLFKDMKSSIIYYVSQQICATVNCCILLCDDSDEDDDGDGDEYDDDDDDFDCNEGCW